MEDLRELYRSDDAYERSMAHYDESIAGWQIQPESLFVETRFGDTHILRVGESSNPPLIFFHGWNGNAAGVHTELDIPRLTKYFCLHLPDTIGQSGKSSPSRPPTDDASYGLWGADIIDALRFEQVYLSGISGGGYLSLKTASIIPDRIIKMFLMVPGGFVDLSGINFRFVMSAIPAAMGFKWGGRFFVRRMLSPNFKDTVLIHKMGEGMQSVLGNLKPVYGPKRLSKKELKRITCPVYVVAAKHDIAVAPYRTVRRARRTLSDVTTQVVEAGHMITIEKRDWLMNELLRFFEMEDG